MRSVLIDTNLLVLLVVGVYRKSLIGEHKRTKQFIPEDFDLLGQTIDGFEAIWITSHCLAEASNLLKQTHASQARELLLCLSAIVANTRESHIQKDAIFKDKHAGRLGVADTGILIKSRRVSCVLTVDFDLYSQISGMGRNVINFNHLRTECLFR